MDKDDNKYNINPEENMPLIVYAPPKMMRKMIKLGVVFTGFYDDLKVSQHYYIEATPDGYFFKYGEVKSGEQIDSNDEDLKVIKRSEKEYIEFIDCLSDITDDWERNYTNPEMTDECHWYIEAKDTIGRYEGTSAFPENYEELKELLISFFN